MKFGYWNFRGLGQVPRLIAAYTKTKIEQKRYSFQNNQFSKDYKKLNFDFPNLPYLIDQSFKINQSGAIARYIIIKSDYVQLLGRNAQDSARIESLLGILKDLLKEVKSLIANKQYKSLKQTSFSKIVGPKAQFIQDFIQNKKWSLDYLTIADFEISECSYYFQAAFPQKYSNYQFWQIIRKNLNSLPQIQAYYKKQEALREPFLPENQVYIQPKFKKPLLLGYWSARGRGQQIRLLLSYLNLQFEEKRYQDDGKAWFQNDKLTLGLTFPNLPYLIDGNFKLTQSSAIQKYVIGLSQHKQLLGKNTKDKAKIQQLLNIVSQIRDQLAKNFWKKDDQVIKQSLEKLIPKLDSLKEYVGERNTIFEYLSLPDFILSERSHYIQFLYPSAYKNWKFLQRIRENINSLESTNRYYNRKNAMKGPFMPARACANPSAEKYL